MKLSLWFAGLLHVTTCALMFVFVLDADYMQDNSLAIPNALLAYPFVAYSIFCAYRVRLNTHIHIFIYVNKLYRIAQPHRAVTNR